MPEIREDEGRQPLAPPVPPEPTPPVTGSDLGEPGSIEQMPPTAPDTGAGATPPAPAEPPVVSPPPPTAPEVSVAAARFNPPPPTDVYAVAHQYLTPDELNYDKNRILQILHDKGAPLDIQLEYARLNIAELGGSEKLIRELNTEAEVRFGQNQFLNDINFAKAQRAFQSSHVQIGDGQWVDKAAFDALPFQYREIGLAKGIEAINDKLAEDGRLAEGEAERYEGESRLAVRSQAEYDKSVEDWLAGQVATGAAKDRADAERQLTEIQSGQYTAWMPDPDDPEDVSKGQYVPVWSEIVAAREQAGLSEQQLGEIYSGKYTVKDPVTGVVSPTTKEIAQARQEFEDWVNTKAPANLRQAYYTGGDAAYAAAAGQVEADSQALLQVLDTYAVKEPLVGPILNDAESPQVTLSYDLAKAIREHPEIETSILRLGAFGPQDIEQAKQYNYQTRGIGTPAHISREAFQKQYFKEQGWDYKLPQRGLDIEGRNSTVYDNRVFAANREYDKKYGAPMTADDFSRAYFEDKGWQYDINRTEAGKAELQAWNKHQNEATGEYVKKFGPEPLFRQAGGKVADLLVPGLWLSDTRNMPATDIALNAAIDVAFLGLMMGKPIAVGAKLAAKGIAKTPAMRTARVFGRIMADTYGRGGTKLNTLLDDAARAIRSQEVRAIREQALGLQDYGRAMKAKGLPGADRIIENSRAMLDNADKFAQFVRAPRWQAPLSQRIKFLAQEINNSQRGSWGRTQTAGLRMDEGILPQRAASTRIQTAGVRTEVIPISREEARGLTDAEVDQIFERARGNREAMLKEIRSMQTQRKAAMDKVFEDINRSFANNEAARKKALEEYYSKLQQSGQDTLARARQAEEARKAYFRELAESRSKEQADLVARAKADEARILAAADRAMADYNALAKGNATTVLAALSSDPRIFAQVLSKMDAQTRAAVLTQLNPALVKALQQHQWARTRSLAKIQAQSQTIGQTREQTSTLGEVRLAALTSQAESLSEAEAIGRTRGEGLAQARLATAAITTTRPQVIPAVSSLTGPRTQLQPQTVTQLQAVTGARVQPVVVTRQGSTAPALSPVPYPKPAPYPRPSRGKTPALPQSPKLGDTRPPLKPPKPEKGRPSKKPMGLPRLDLYGIGNGGSVPLLGGSIAWRQGMFWKYIPPPFDQPKPITLPRGVTPIGAVNTELLTPQETIQMIGRSGAAIPDQFNIDLGVVDIFVRDGGRSIEYHGKGGGTDVGTRLPSPTQGMDSERESDTLDIEYGSSESSGQPGEPARAKQAKQRAPRKRRREDDYSDLLSVRGMRF